MTKYLKPPRVGEQTFIEPQQCPVCFRPAKKVTTQVFSNDPYNGNLVLIRSVDQWAESLGLEANYYRNDDPVYWRRYEHLVWDGETYVQRYGHFCSQPCAVWYANTAYKRGAA